MRLKRLLAVGGLAAALAIYQGVLSVPSDMTMFRGETHTIQTLGVVSLSAKSPREVPVERSRGFTRETLSFSPNEIGSYEYQVSVLGIPCRSVQVSVEENKTLMASGNAVGVKIYASGLMVVGFADIGARCPALESGMAVGDVILTMNGEPVQDSDHFSSFLTKGGAAPITLQCRRGDSEYTVEILPEKSEEGKYCIGAWVRDSIAGVGTLTFFDPRDGRFVSLGHSISDYDTGGIIDVDKGSIVPCRIQSVEKGEPGKAGELRGVFAGGEDLGIIEENESYGVVGVLKNNALLEGKEVPIGLSSQIHVGEATILTTVDENRVEEYKIEVEKIISLSGNKNMIISVTDPKLLRVTGGIVQGMSGSPILQDGKLIGAVTHVFVDDPTRGYGIFVENMME